MKKNLIHTLAAKATGRRALLGISVMLAATAGLMTSCKEVLGSLDNPVSSYLTVNVADVTIPTGDTFQ